MTKLSNPIALISGDGSLPLKLVKSANAGGFEVVGIALAGVNKKELSKQCVRLYSPRAGEVQRIADILKEEKLTQVMFIGKVSKSIVVKSLFSIDKRGLELLKNAKKLNDDAIMNLAVKELEKEGVEVIDQTIFLKELMALKGVMTKNSPTKEEMADINYGFETAKELGRLDIGQSVVVQDRMILAVEAIEGTDEAIKRGGKLGNKNATLVKVSKPNQDKRFDVPTVGLKTLKTMKRHGVKILAVEANETFMVGKDEMVKFADRHNMVIIGV